jgi:pilus assembly protein CpaB
VVAARDLAVGALIQEADLKMAGFAGALPKGAVLKRDTLLNRGVVSSIYEDEPVTDNRLASKGSGGGLAATIPPGMRASAVRVNEVVGVAGFVVPGMRVDVLITGLPPGANTVDGPRVRTLLQDIQVLSAGTDFQKDQAGKPQQVQVVILLVTPAQAETLSLASNEMHIQLVLRNPMDTRIVEPPGTNMSNLFGGARAAETAPPGRTAGMAPGTTPPRRPAPPPAAQPPVPGVYTIEVDNGAVHTQARFDRPLGKP